MGLATVIVRDDIKTAFVLPPKCGSMSIKRFLLSLGFVPLVHSTFHPYNHTKYQDAVKVFPELSDYSIYGVFRDPLERFVSALKFACAEVSKYGYDYFVENFDKIHPNARVFFERQVEWLDQPRIKVLDFSNIANDITDVVKGLNVKVAFPHLNSSPAIDLPISDAVRAFVKDRYLPDYQFAKLILGKNYL